MTNDKTGLYSVGIDLGGTKIAVGLCSEGIIRKKVLKPTNAEKGPIEVIKVMSDAVKEACEGVPAEKISGVGVGAAGQIDAVTGKVIYAPNLGWENVHLAEVLKKNLSMNIKVTNDVRAATIAELYYGAGKGLTDFLNIFVGTGIGSGFVINGKIIEGVTNTAGEIGHTCLDPEGPLCGCGKQGCFEAFSSGRAIENFVKSKLLYGYKSEIMKLADENLNKVSCRIIGQAARNGDSLALSSLERAGMYIGLVIANIHTMLNPQTVILGGGVMGLKEFIVPAIEKAVEKFVLPVSKRDNFFTMALCENDAGILGSAALFI
ncbi:MAG: ROK family protein [Candidatus Riflebacteria bacterium]|nr:ROK family protein [Candidatus Riflebacteria bacterium]